MLSKKNKSNGVLLSLIICIFALQTVSCGTTDSDEIESSYFYVSIQGPSMNGEYRIEEDEDPTTHNLLGLIYPLGEDIPNIALLTFSNNQGFGVTIQVPAEKRRTELTDGHDYFLMLIVSEIDEVILHAKSVSIDVTRFENNSFGITEMRANFEGVMAFKVDGVTEESHTVKGEFTLKPRPGASIN